MGIRDFHQENYKLCIIKYLDNGAGAAYANDVTDYWRSQFLREGTFTLEEFEQRDACGDNTWKKGFRAAAQQLRKEGFLEKHNPKKLGLWVRTEKPYIC
jgi:hypothetical protein